MLLPVVALLRRYDLAEVIGEALALRVAGWGHRRIAIAFDRPSSALTSNLCAGGTGVPVS